MSDFSERLLVESRGRKRAPIQPVALVLVPVAATLFQAYVPHVFPTLGFLEAPLLVTLHFALRRRGPLAAVFYGCAVGLLEDTLSHQPLGMYGIVSTLVGYFAASVSQRFEVEHPATTVVLTFLFYLFHRFFYWVLARALLGQLLSFDPPQALIFGLLNAIVALPLFLLLDKLRGTAQ
jgi:rod shape-determining protein MreD